MIERVTDQNLAEYEAFIRQHPKGLFCHSRAWGKVKSAWKWEAVMLKSEDGSIKGAASMLIRSMPVVKYTLVYICRGFVCDENDFETFDALYDGVMKIAKEHKAYLVKIDPEISIENKEWDAHIKSKGFQLLPCAIDGFDNVQPKFVYCFDYNGRDEEQLLKDFHSKTRYNIRLAERKGVTVKLCGKEMLDAFTEIMKETGERDGFTTRPASYFASVLDNLGEDARLYMAFLDDKPIAGTLAIRFGHTMKYQYGASSNAYRNVMPNYLLQWEMIKWGLESGCSIYDFGGISGDLEDSSKPLYGLYRFKKGFTGYVVEFVGEYDLVLKPMINKAYKLASKIM